MTKTIVLMNVNLGEVIRPLRFGDLLACTNEVIPKYKVIAEGKKATNTNATVERCHGYYDDTNWKQAFDKYFMPFLISFLELVLNILAEVFPTAIFFKVNNYPGRLFPKQYSANIRREPAGNLLFSGWKRPENTQYPDRILRPGIRLLRLIFFVILAVFVKAFSNRLVHHMTMQR
ncbi:unnamed protein product [Adineta ricciae]|uniref:Uncharacterized protein n=1 Tax=Adineta ricciae TaxID=249248 RepID=A0A813ZKY0_ADIRI|nr:unnamed protein product [Adineta ricciae]